MKTEIRKPKIYLASPFFNEEQVALVEQVEEALELNPFVGAYFSPMRNQLEALPQGTPEWANAVYYNDVNHIDWADIVVAVLNFDGSTEIFSEKHYHVDSGTAFEVGMAVAKNKPIILLNTQGGMTNLMLTESCHAYLNTTQELVDYNFLKMPEIKYKGEYV